MSASQFTQNLAIIVGINQYSNGISTLQTATNDAHQLAHLLRVEHGYEVQLLLDQASTRKNLLSFLEQVLPQVVSADDRILFYFAGHGIALDGDDGPSGYLVPQDAKPGEEETFLPMRVLHDALTALPCRHSLIILDCCFSGSFRWSSTRDIAAHPEIIYKERYDRFIQSPAWQVITSSAYDQTAFDLLQDQRGQGHTGQHSPFAEALFDALRGYADRYPVATDGQPSGDGVITATELYLYLRDRVELATEAINQRQTPGLWPLRKHDKGEYIFLVPGHELNLPPAPALNSANNPYRGLESFDEAQAHLFFGRHQLVKELQSFVLEHPLTVVLGPSGTGKSSLVKAGLVPALRNSIDADWQILPPIRPGDAPLKALALAILSLEPDNDSLVTAVEDLAENLARDPRELTRRVLAWGDRHPHKQLLLVIDQFEELITQCRQETERQQFLELLKKASRLGKTRGRIVLTLRSDFEPQFQAWLPQGWMRSRFLIKPMAQDELRQAIEAPAAERVMVFEPYNLVDQLINEVVQMPGALPLLSFTLSELYLRYLQRRSDDRALTQTDYEALGGVAGSLTQRASQEYESLKQQDPAYEHTMKRVMLRMVAIEGGELARRRVPRSELVYPDEAENIRVEVVIQHLTAARLVVKGQDLGGEPYVEPAHDALVQGWNQLQRWKNEEQESLSLQRLLTPAAKEWANNQEGKRSDGFLWNNNPRLDLLKANLQSDQSWLNQLERKFVNCSINRRRNNNLRLISSLLTVVLALSGLTIFAFLQQAEAQRQSTEAQRQSELAQDNEARAQANATEAQANAAEAERNAAEAEANAAEAERNATEAERNANEAEKQRLEAETNAAEAEKQRQQAENQQQRAEAGEAEANRQTGIAREQTLLAQEEALNAKIRTESVTAENLVAANFNFKAFLKAMELGRWIISQEIRFPANEENKITSMFQASIRPEVKLQAISILREIYNFDGYMHWNSLPDKDVKSVKFSPTGKLFASASINEINLWDAQTGRHLRTLNHSGWVNSISFSPNGQTLVSVSFEGTIKHWDVNTGREIQSFVGHSASIWDVSFSPNGHLIASASPEDVVALWDIDAGRKLRTLADSNNARFSTISFSPDGRLIAGNNSNSQVVVWEVATGQKLNLINTPVSSLKFVSNERILTANSDDGTVILWDIQTKQKLQTIEGHSKNHSAAVRNISSLSVSDNEKTLATAGHDGTVKLWDISTGNKLQVLREHTGFVTSVSFSPNGETIVSASNDGTLKLWNKSGRKLNVVESPILTDASANYVSRVSLSPDRKIIVSAADSTLVLWDATTEQLKQTFEGHDSWITSVSFSGNGGIIASASYLGLVKVWEVSTGKELLSVRDGKNVGLSLDGSMIASATSDNAVKIRKVSTGKELKVLVGHASPIESIRFSEKSDIVATGDWNGVMKLWSLKTGQVLKTLTAHTSWVNEITFSADDRLVASASEDGTARIWNAATGELIQTLSGHGDRVMSVDFSSDGHTLATASVDGTVKLWEVNTGQELQTLDRHTDMVLTVRFWPDNQIITSASRDGKLIFWNFDLYDLMAKSCTWLRDYMTNPATPPEHKALCQDDLPELASSSQFEPVSWLKPIASVLTPFRKTH
jgi:WD40 repeat protein/cytoskeletal protein RodZ